MLLRAGAAVSVVTSSRTLAVLASKCRTPHRFVQNSSKPTDRAYATERTCAEQQQMVCVARRRTKGGERFHHNCEAPDRLMWDLLPPLNVTEHWPPAKMRAYAHGRFDVPTEGELRAVSRVGQPRSAQGSEGPAGKTLLERLAAQTAHLSGTRRFGT